MLTSCSLLAASAVIAGCSGSAGSPLSGSSSEKTGSIVAELDTIPSDVRCLNVYAYGAGYANVYVDVTSGSKATVHLGSLQPGEYYLYGSAYNGSCSAVQNGGFNDAGADGGAAPLTWVADQASVFVAAGDNARATLHFFPLGALTVGTSFDSCADAGNSNFCVHDGGGIDAGAAVD
jgi:hypothetical protein